MGKGISTGCDIVFIINGSKETPLRIGTTISAEEVSYETVARALMSQNKYRDELGSRLKYETSVKLITEEDLEIEGLVPNGTVFNLALAYPDYDWSEVNQSIKIIATDWCSYYGEKLDNVIIEQVDPTTNKPYKIYVIDPSNLKQVSLLNDHLSFIGRINKMESETKTIIEEAKLLEIIKTIPEILDKWENEIKKISELEKKEEDDLSPKELKELTRLKGIKENYDAFKAKNGIPKNEVELLLDFVYNKDKYRSIIYIHNGSIVSANARIGETIKQILGKKIKTAGYKDIFANEVYTSMNYNFSTDLSSIKVFEMLDIIERKYNSLLKDVLDSPKKNSSEIKEKEKLIRALRNFLDLTERKAKNWKEVLDLLVDSTDDEFSYLYDSMTLKTIFLKNVPRTLEAKYADFTYKTIQMLTPLEEEYKGYTIYKSKEEDFYISRHKLTTKSYGRKFESIEKCKEYIDKLLTYDAIGRSSLIEFKTLGERQVVYVPNRYVPGQIVKSIDMKLNLNQSLNPIEQDLIYNYENTISDFYNYVLSILNTNKAESYKKNLQETIDTAEKAFCFIYLLNLEYGIDRKKLSLKQYQEILDKFKDIKYNYYIVEQVGKQSTGGSQYGFKMYTRLVNGDKLNIGTYKTLLTPVRPSEFSNGFIKYHNTSGRLVPCVRMLRDLSNKIEAKLGIKIHIETFSDLKSKLEKEEKDKKWSNEVLNEAKGFIKNGEIYINASNATQEDLFHEFTHIMLGVLKAKNFDNYYDLVNLVASTDYGKGVKKRLRKLYPNLADSDLNEEVFADLFAMRLAGKNLGLFLNGKLKELKKAVDEKMESIFGKEPLTEEFYSGSLDNIFKLFGYDLGMLLNEGNGLELNSGKSFRLASNWIASLIDLHNKDNKLGIYEKCD